MMGNKIKNVLHNKTIILNVMAIIIIVAVASIYIKDSYGLKIVGDEFGYWSSAAWLAGYDWTDVASFNEYYGYGYGLILYFILKLNLSYRATYQLALCVNVVMLVGIYFIAYKLINKLDDKLNIYIRVAIAMSSVLYTGVIYYTQFTMCETLICLLYWIIIYNAYCLLEQYSIKTILFQVLLLAYCFAVHQRLIGLLIVGLLFIVYVVTKNKKWKDLLCIIPVIFAALYIVVMIKNSYKSGYLSFGDMSLDANEFGGQVSKIKQLFTMDGIIKFIVGFLGKIYYACSSTFFLFFIFLVWMIREIVQSKKEKKITRNGEFFLFVFLATIVTIAISVVFLLDYSARFDLLVYGRYFEFALSPIIVLGMLRLVNADHKSAIYEWMYIAYIFLAFVVYKFIPYEASKNLVFFMCTGIANTLFEYNYEFYIVTTQTFLTFFAIKIISNRKKQNTLTKLMPIALLIIIWSYSFLVPYKEGCLSWAQSAGETEECLAKEIVDLDAEEDLHYYMAEDTVKIDCLQFVLKEHKIHAFANEEYVYGLDENDYILTMRSTKLFENLTGVSYEVIATSDNLALWKRVDY
ncbi:MAG: hypothetical protein ACI4L2_08960 [Wujia sp.]